MILLASTSPRRAALLALHGVPFVQIAPPDGAEELLDALSKHAQPPMLAKHRAFAKAMGVVGNVPPDAIVLGADTVVYAGGEILGKPKDMAAARRMLRKLSGRWHEVHTGVAIITREKSAYFSDVDTAQVKFKKLSNAQIDRYLELVNPLDKAGGYALQEHGAMLVDMVDGEPETVIGLPVGMVLEAVADLQVRGGLGPGWHEVGEDGED